MVFFQAFMDSLTGKIKPLEQFVGQTGQNLRIFHISCGDCNGCALEIQALQGAAYDLKKSGICFVNHPAHADVLMITGLLNRTMIPYIEKSWKLIAGSKVIVTVGSCAMNQHFFKSNYAISEENAGGEACILQIPGCPPTPKMIIEYLMNLRKDRNSGLFLNERSPFSSRQELSGHPFLDDGNCDNSKELNTDKERHLMPASPKDL